MKRLPFALACIGLLSCTTPGLDVRYASRSGDVAGPPVTRSEVILTADKYARVHWTMREVNRKGIHCDGNFISKYPVGLRIGMGYKWGGWDTVEDFLAKIAEGRGTGTGGPVFYEKYPFECVTGTSCTGLVSRAWHLGDRYTLTYPDRPDIPRQFHEITHVVPEVNFLTHKTEGLKKGDAFMKKSRHIILFVYETRDGAPMVIDSRSRGVGFRKTSWFALWGYTPLRYNNIQDDINPSGTTMNPIIVDSDAFPYTHVGNTRNVVSMEFDRYAVAPDVNQQGPETIYRLLLKSSGTISIQITDIKDEGIDNDIHLLSILRRDDTFEATDCIARGDNRIIRYLDTGTYYTVVDSRKDLPGEYTLTVDRLRD